MRYFILVLALLFSPLSIAAPPSSIEQLESELGQLAAPKSYHEPITLLLYGDESTFSPYLEGNEIRKLENAYGLPVLSYAIRNANDLRSTLLFLTKFKFLIQNLMVRGLHGGTYESVPTFEIHDNETGDFESISFDDLAKLGVSLNFSPTAFLFFDSCTMIEKENLKSMSVAFTEVQKIGFHTGWIYLNHTEATYGILNTFGVPFFDHPGNTKAKLIQLGGRIAGLVTIPYLIYLDHFKNNFGYLRGLSPTHEVILKTSAYDVQYGKISGQLFYSR